VLFLATSAEKGLLQELWEYFIDKYFSVEMPYLENFTVTSNSLISIRLIIIGLTFGLIAAAIMTVYNKRYLGDFIRLLISEECFDASSAKTLSELGYLKNPVIRGVIKSGGSLSRWARCVEEDEFFAEVDKKRKEFEEAHKDEKHPPKFKAPEFRRDCNTMHFYLPGEKKYAAEIKFESKGAHWGMVIIVAIIALIVCAFLCYMLPDVLKMVDNFITMAKGPQ
jgi:hypothetical protein